MDIEGEFLVRGQAQAAHGFTQVHPRTASRDPGLEVATRLDEGPRDRIFLRPIPGHRAIEEAVILADATEAVQADLRALGVGIAGRISRTQELEWSDDDLAHRTRKFLDALQVAFASEFKKKPVDFRKTSLLSSGTIFRVLAGVWFDLTSSTNAQGKPIKPRMSVEDATSFFMKLAPHMTIPIKMGSPWLTTGVFPSPANGASVTAPGSRNQELKKLTLEITNWALKPESFPFK